MLLTLFIVGCEVFFNGLTHRFAHAYIGAVIPILCFAAHAFYCGGAKFLFNGLTHRFAHAYIGAVIHFVSYSPNKTPNRIGSSVGGEGEVRGFRRLDLCLMPRGWLGIVRLIKMVFIFCVPWRFCYFKWRDGFGMDPLVYLSIIPY
ncbi:hypothetical protein PRIP_08827 [Listeria riparia FSL S10-1204]|uniref:Uncharacterized protein n=1 Tax=Listeria riparia FSL S10-1204 TaxID=1265816 RepID=W7D6P7_9LIST|nr:hypothetical protein PRIP_08827 [Listeria riparia FSL S10-1204]